MKAVVIQRYGDFRQLRLETVEQPALPASSVRVAVRAIGVNYPDLLVIAGKYQTLPPLPCVPGKDAAGEIIELGAGVHGFRIGQRVLCHLEHGAYAEEVVAPSDWVCALPDAIDFDQAAAMGLAYQTAHFALLERGSYQRGETVLVNGAAGAVGYAAVQLAKALGAKVLAGVRNETQAAIAREAGADHSIDLAATNLRDSLRAQVHGCTDGRGVDVVLDPLGGDVFDASMRALAWRGRIVVIGFAAGRIPEIKANYLLLKNVSVSGLQWSDYRQRDPAWLQRAQRELFELYLQQRLRPRIVAGFPLERFGEALALQAGGGANGKIVLATGQT